MPSQGPAHGQTQKTPGCKTPVSGCGAASGWNSGCARAKASVTAVVSAAVTVHTANTSVPPGRTLCAAPSSKVCWSAALAATAPASVRQRMSGLRFQVPMPLQGASTKTPSNSGPSRIARPGSRVPRSSTPAPRPSSLSCCVWIIVTPASAARRSSSRSAPERTSVASSDPRFSINAARCSVLPPAPAQTSHQRAPGRGAQSRPAHCEARSCTMAVTPVAVRSPCRFAGGKTATAPGTRRWACARGPGSLKNASTSGTCSGGTRSQTGGRR